jgi:hypothetical protein
MCGPGSGDHPRPVRAHHRPKYNIGLAGKRSKFAAGFQAQHFERAFPRGGQGTPPSRTHRHSKDIGGMAFEQARPGSRLYPREFQGFRPIASIATKSPQATPNCHREPNSLYGIFRWLVRSPRVADSEECQNSERRPFVFGSAARHARRCLEAISNQCSNQEQLLELVATVAGFSALRPQLIVALREIRGSRELSQALGHRLAAAGDWTMPETLELAMWLRSNAADDWQSWLITESAFPSVSSYSSEIWPELLSISRRQYAGLPVSIYCDGGELSSAKGTMAPAERYALTHMRFARDPTVHESAVDLLEAAVDCRLDSTVAALFAEGHLDSTPFAKPVVNAFNSLDWIRFGCVKQEFARRVPLAPNEPEGAADIRLASVQSLVRGDALVALHRLESLVVSPSEVDSSLAREFLAAFLASGRKPRNHEQQLLSRLADRPDFEWIEFLLNWSRSDSIDEQHAEQITANPALPPVTDPLFGAVAGLLMRLFSLREDRKEAWSRIQTRLCAIDPLWESRVPFPDRDYADVLAKLRAAGTDPIPLVVNLRRVLLLPVDVRWIRRVLAVVVSGRSGARLLEEDGLSSPLGLLVIDLCIRTVDFLLACHAEIREADAVELTSGDPVAVAAVLMLLLTDLAQGS